MVAFGADWSEPYTCEQWMNSFDITYPIADFETGMPNWYQEDIPYYLYMPEMGWGLPYNIIIDHNMEIVWGGANDLGEEEVWEEAVATIENALNHLNVEALIDNDEDGIANECDDCPDSHLYATGNFDFSEEFLVEGLNYGYYPSIEIYDLLILSDLVNSGDEISPCYVEASDFTGDNALDLIDIMALANYIIEGN